MRVTIHYDNKETLYTSIITWLTVSITYLTADKMLLQAAKKNEQAENLLLNEIELATDVLQKLTGNKDQDIDFLKTQLSRITKLGLQRKEGGFGTTVLMNEALAILFKVEQYYLKQQTQKQLQV